MTGDIVRQFVEFSLPKPCEFGEENFAGDSQVRAFCDRCRDVYRIDASFFVSWACAPDVAVVRTVGGDAIVRSERLDTLLVEYHNFRRMHESWSDEFAGRVIESAALRWMSEFLIDYRQPGLAILSNRLRPGLPAIRLTSPFRDETLATVAELDRVALQCTCLAHEMGHIQFPRRTDATIDDEIDGTPVAKHLGWQDGEIGHSEEVQLAMRSIQRDRIDGPALLNEIEADLFAFSSVLDFLCNGLHYGLEESIRAMLRAFEAQLFICASKNTCRLLATSLLRGTSREDFLLEDYLISSEYLARARTIARRAGIIWAVAEQPDALPGTREYNSYVSRIDAMILEVQPFTYLASQSLVDGAHRLFERIAEANDQSGSWLDSEFRNLENSGALRTEFFEILIAFGCPGGVDVMHYMTNMRSLTQRA